MAEVTYTSCHVADLSPGKGRGLMLLGLDITVGASGRTVTTGLTEISGLGWAVEDGAVDIATQSCTFAISGGTITVYEGKISDYTFADNAVRLIAMGVVR